jgi:hypothetical protein
MLAQIRIRTQAQEARDTALESDSCRKYMVTCQESTRPHPRTFNTVLRHIRLHGSPSTAINETIDATHGPTTQYRGPYGRTKSARLAMTPKNTLTSVMANAMYESTRSVPSEKISSDN